MKRCAWLLAAGIVFYAGACNCGRPSSPPDGGADSGIPVTAQTVCSDLAVKACDFFIRCHSEPTLGFDLGEGRAVVNQIVSNDQVAESERARCEALISQSPSCVVFSSSVDAGRMSFDSAGYGGCSQALYPTDTCARDLNAVLTSRCNALPFLVANTPPGALCELDRECTGGFCSNNPNQTATCGTCQAPLDAGTGAPCSRDSQCDGRVEYCPGPDGTGGSCTPFAALGDGCDPLDRDQEQCGPGNVCAVTQTFPQPTGQCEVEKKLGDSCTVGKFECARVPHGGAIPQLVCAPGTSSDGGIRYQCVPLQAGAGGACEDGDSIPLAVAFPICLETEWCNSNLCTPRKAATQTCGTHAECVAGTQCTQSNSARTCQPFKESGTACGDSSQCKNLLACPSGGGTCGAEYSITGEPCGANNQGRSCVEGYCPSPAAANCAAYKETGAACAGDGECRSSVCATQCQTACWQG